MADRDQLSIEDKVDALFGLNEPEELDDAATDTGESTAVADAGASTDGQAPATASTDDAAKPDVVEGSAPDTEGEPKPSTQAKPVAGPQDLVDPQTGEVIAKAGKERRWHDAAQTARRQVSDAQAQMQAVSAELTAYKQAATMPRELGLSPEQVTTAMRFMHHWSNDPLAAAKQVLAEVQALGYSIQELGGTDIAAVKRIVEDATKPFTQEREAAQRNSEAQMAIETEYNTISAEFTWLTGQDEEIGMMLEAAPNLSLREAALQLEVFALRNGYDMNKPIKAQHLASQQAPATPTQAVPTPVRINRAAAPAVTNLRSVVPVRNTAAPLSNNTRDILKAVMRENGMNTENL